MSKEYKVKFAGRIYEVSPELYYSIRREQRRHRYLKSTQENVVVLSYDALKSEDFNSIDILMDQNANVEENVIRQLMIEKLKDGLTILTDDELYIINHLIYQEMTERELSQLTGIPQQTINDCKKRALNKLKKFLTK